MLITQYRPRAGGDDNAQFLSGSTTLQLAADFPSIALAGAGTEVEIEIGRSGSFTDMHGQTVQFDAQNLAELAGNLDPDALIKIGHVSVDTTTPRYGQIRRLRYDAAVDRLLAAIVPSKALVRKNQEEGFDRVSAELGCEKLPRGPFVMHAIAFLAARKAAISCLTPVRLAAGETLRLAGRDSVLNPRVQFAKSELHDRALLRLSELRKTDPKTTYTEALESVTDEAARTPGGLSRAVKFAESGIHQRALVKLTGLRKTAPRTTYTEALEVVTDEEARRPDGLNRGVQFAKSEVHEKALTHLAEMREDAPGTTYTEALEAATDSDHAG